MNKYIVFIFSAMFFSIAVKGQKFFFIGDKSFKCTDTFILKANTIDRDVNDLKILFGKDVKSPVLIASIKSVSTVRISGKLTVYLDDGTVISCIDRGINDNVDGIASSAYLLTNDELLKLKKSNINTIRYTVKCIECFGPIPAEGNYTASNKGTNKTDFPVILTNFFGK